MTSVFSGYLNFDIPVSELTTSLTFSDAVNIGHIPWKMGAVWNKVGESENLCLAVYCNDKSTSHSWTCNAQVVLYLMKGNKIGLCKEFLDKDHRFDKISNVEFSRFIEKNASLLPENGFLKDEKLSFVAHIQVKSSFGILEIRIPDFWKNANDTFIEAKEESYKLKLCAYHTSRNNIEYLALYAYCIDRKRANLWSCVAEVHLHLMRGDEYGLTRRSEDYFNEPHARWGFDKFIEINELSRSANGFLNEDMFTIVAEIEIKFSIGIREIQISDYSTVKSIDPRDGSLVKDQKLVSTKISGAITHECNISELTTDSKFSHSVEIAKIPWKLSLHWGTTDGVEYLEAYVCCEGKTSSTLWSCDADFYIYFMRGNRKRLQRHGEASFNNSTSNWGTKKLIKKKELLYNSAYVRNGNLKVVVELDVKFSFGTRKIELNECFSNGDDDKLQAEIQQLEIINISGSISHQTSLSTLGRSYSNIVQIGNIPWKLCTQWDTTNNVEYLEVYVYCNNDSISNLWSCNARTDVKLMSHNGKGLTKNLENLYKKGDSNCGLGKFISKKDLMHPENGYVKNSLFTIVANVTIISTVGIRKIKVPDVLTTRNPYGEIVFEVDEASALATFDKFSKTIEIGNIPWRITTKFDIEEGEEYLGIYACCNDESLSTSWLCHAEIAFYLMKGSERGVSKLFECSFKENLSSRGIGKIIKKRDLLRPGNGYVKDDKFTIVAKIEVKSSVGFNAVRSNSGYNKYEQTPSKNQSSDFLVPQHTNSEVTLVLRNKKLYVDKNVLVSSSPVLNSLFAIRNQKQVEIKHVDGKYFIEFLRLLHKKFQKVTDENIEGLLKLADHYAVQFLLEDLEDFLIEQSNVSNVTKFVLAEKYHFSVLQEETLKKLVTVQEIESVYDNSTDIGIKTATALLERMFVLTR